MRVYLAGPDVFRPDAVARGLALKQICAEFGLAGVFPLDPRPAEEDPAASMAEWQRIALCNEAHIRSCAALVANLTPFRGPSADPGTVFELGFMRALGRPVFAWSNDGRCFTTRTLACLGARAQPDSHGTWRDDSGMAVESFGCADNLMIDGAIHHSGGAIIRRAGNADKARQDDDLAAFRECVARLATLLGAGRRAKPAQRQR